MKPDYIPLALSCYVFDPLLCHDGVHAIKRIEC